MFGKKKKKKKKEPTKSQLETIKELRQITYDAHAKGLGHKKK